jgi:hypothetical protein
MATAGRQAGAIGELMAEHTHDEVDVLKFSDKVSGFVHVDRVCRYHPDEPLVKHQNLWAVVGVLPVGLPTATVGSSAKQLVSSNRAFGLNLWRCGRCGYVELSDAE